MAKEGLSLNWSASPLVLADAMAELKTGLRDRLHRNLEGVGANMLAYAAGNHPWQNRTGEAEAGLSAEVLSEEGGERLVLYHTAPHGLWLEVKHNGRWGIIPASLAAHEGEAMQAGMDALGG